MKLVIFGAGASFDSIHSFYDDHSYENEAWRPPLANQIFSDRKLFVDIIKDFKGALSLKSEITLRNDIEDYFQNLWDFAKKHNDDLINAKIINTQYFLQKLFFEISEQYKNIGNSNYDVISNFAYKYAKSKNEEVLFVSFNYDLLLENSLERALNIEFLEIEDYIKHEIKYIKPHGSCNWFVNFEKSIGNGTISALTEWDNNTFIDKLYDKKISNEIIYKNLEYNIVVRNTFYDDDNIGLPQLLIPLKEKDEFVLPTEHLNYLEENLSKVNEILIIGWKGTEAKFVELLKKHLSDKEINITTVNNGDFTIREQMIAVLPKAKIDFYPFKLSSHKNGRTDTFTNFVKTQAEYNNQDSYFFKLK